MSRSPMLLRFRSSLLVPLVVLVLATLAAAELRAETVTRASSSDTSSEAVDRYRRARSAFDAGDYERAIRLFVEADRLAPRPALSFNIARSYEKLGNEARALEHYRHYLRREPGGPGAKRAASRVGELEAELERRGVQQITVSSTLAGAQISIDERALGVTPWTGELPPGRHTLVVTHAGFAKTTRAIEVSADRALEIEVVLARASSESVTLAADSSSSPGPSFKERVGPWPFVAFGASAVAFSIAGAYELERSDAEAAARASRTQLEYAVHRDEAESRETTARVLAGVGGGLALLGGVWLGVGLLDDSEEEPEEQTRARLWFDCGASACAAHFRERF